MTDPTDHGALDVAQLYRDHRDAVYRFLLRRCAQRTLAEDLTHDTFERVTRWSQSHDWQDRGRHPISLLFTIAANLLRDYQTSNQRRERAHSDFTSDVAPLWSAATRPFDDLLTDQLQRPRWRHLLTTLLSDQQRHVLCLTFVHGLSDRDTGRKLGLGPDAIKECRYRALQRLRASTEVLELAR